MYTNSNTIKLFDANNNFVDNFDEEIEKILISIHGENYYDIDEDIQNTNVIKPIYHDEELDKTIEFVDSLVIKDAPKIKIVEKKKHKVSILDFMPVLFFIIIFAIIVFAGYYFLSTFDFTELIK